MQTAAWIVALLALLLALGVMFVPAIFAFQHLVIGMGIGLVAAALLLTLPRPTP